MLIQLWVDLRHMNVKLFLFKFINFVKTDLYINDLTENCNKKVFSRLTFKIISEFHNPQNQS